MAIQFTDFSKAKLLDSPAATMLEDVLKGYKMEKEPEKMAEEQKQRQLTNQLKQLDVDHKPKEYELDDKGKQYANSLKALAMEHYDEKFKMARDLNDARINKLNNKASTDVIKPNGKVANIAWVKKQLEDPNIDPEYASQLKGALDDAKEHEETIINRSKDAVAGNSFDKLPVNDKKQSVALMKGMGVDPVESVAYLRKKGNSPTSYAKEKGIDIYKVIPDYAAGEQNIKDAQQVVAYQDELKVFEDHITDGLKQYQNKIKGYSMKQIAEAADGKNTDGQAKALAARALVPELNSLRLKIMGGNIGIEALNELKHTSLSELKIIESLVDEKTYEAAQNYVSKWISEAGNIRVKSLVGHSMLKERLEKGAEQESHMGKDPLGLR